MKSILRGEVEARLSSIESAFLSTPENDGNRRAYADILYKAGLMKQANEVIAPLAGIDAVDIDDVRLGASLAYLLGDYPKAEALFGRRKEIAPPGSDARSAALEGLALTYYQTNRYEQAKDLDLSKADKKAHNDDSLVTFMKSFPGAPYRLKWASSEKTARLPIINDFAPAGALPLVRLKVNGRAVELILDTGGDRLYIDERVARRIGIRTLATRKAKYAYTGGKTVKEPLGVAASVEMDAVTLENVPVIVARWTALGLTGDGVITTQILKQFLTTVDYDRREIIFRERSEAGRQEMLDSFAGDPVRLPFWMAATHLMFTRGRINGRTLNYFVDSGLAMSMPLVVTDETVEDLGLSDRKTKIEGTPYFWVPIDSLGMEGLQSGATQALGNILVEKDSYWGLGFLADALISHQYLRHLGSWTIDFDAMSYYFPPDAPERAKRSSGGR
ncbi:MAG: hypothetical protein FJY83_11245 [Candidatus Aminicenantes bacterium]|nr:hypothetical protein [Candidatus Aminicenantes bacterium]